MKRLFSLFLVFSLIGSLGTSAVSAKAATMKLNKKNLTLSAGNSYTLKVKKAVGKVKWKSSKKSVATVSSKGKVKAKKTGTAKITATVGRKKLTCRVKVKALAKGTKQNPLSAYSANTFNYYEEGKKRGRFTLKLLRFESGDAAAELAKSNATNPVPEQNEEYIYFKFQIQYHSGEQTVNARDVFNYYYNIYGADCTKQLKNLDWGFFFEPVDDLGTTTLSPGNKIICSKAVLVNKGNGPVTYCISTGNDVWTWFTMAR